MKKIQYFGKSTAIASAGTKRSLHTSRNLTSATDQLEKG